MDVFFEMQMNDVSDVLANPTITVAQAKEWLERLKAVAENLQKENEALKEHRIVAANLGQDMANTLLRDYLNIICGTKLDVLAMRRYTNLSKFLEIVTLKDLRKKVELLLQSAQEHMKEINHR